MGSKIPPMKTPSTKRIPPVRVGDTTVRIYAKGPNLWTVKWREAGKARATSVTGKLEEAKEKAREKAKVLDAKSGGAIVTGEELELLRKVKQIAGERSAFLLMDEVGQAIEDLRGHSIAKAVAFYVDRGPLLVEAVTVSDAVKRFLGGYGKKSAVTVAGLRKELEGFCGAYGQQELSSVSPDQLEGWIGRALENGNPPSPRFFNNRLGTWNTFLRRCQKWKYLRPGGEHPASHIEKQAIESKSPAILSIEKMKKLLEAVPSKLLPYVAVGGFAGVRPFEMLRLNWEDFDWRTNSLHVTLDAGKKTGERFVPLQPNLVEMLKPFRENKGKFCMTHSREMVSNVAREKGIVTEWVQDVLRHSFCSYRLAQTSNIGLVAEEAGNSPNIIKKHYKKPMLKADGVEWFKIKLEVKA
jgi:integrase